MFSGCYLGSQPKVEGGDQLGNSWQQLRQELIRMETTEVAGGRVRSNRSLEIFNVPAAFCWWTGCGAGEDLKIMPRFWVSRSQYLEAESCHWQRWRKEAMERAGLERENEKYSLRQVKLEIPTSSKWWAVGPLSSEFMEEGYVTDNTEIHGAE